PTRARRGSSARTFRPAAWGGFSQEADLQPHRSRYWLNANPLDPEVFRQQATAVCDLYERAGALAEQGIPVVSTDEKTAIQALPRLHPDVAMGPGRVQKRESEYVRHGTLCLTAHRELWCGWGIAPGSGPARAGEGFQGP